MGRNKAVALVEEEDMSSSKVQPLTLCSDEKDAVQQELDWLRDWIQRGMVVQIEDLKRVTEEDNYFLLKVSLSSDINEVPMFTTLTFKMTKQAFMKLFHEADSMVKYNR